MVLQWLWQWQQWIVVWQDSGRGYSGSNGGYFGIGTVLHACDFSSIRVVNLKFLITK
jgi:hypothetical protein